MLLMVCSLQASDIPEKAATDIHLNADNSTFKDFDPMSKDAEKATKL